MESVWQELARVMKFDPARICLNPHLALEVVVSYFRHIDRYKADQNIPKADQHKIGGFMVYWICRLRPVQLILPCEDVPKEEEILANELFAIKLGTAFLSCQSDLNGDYDFFHAFVHRLRERECPPEFLASKFYLYERMRIATCAGV